MSTSENYEGVATGIEGRRVNSCRSGVGSFVSLYFNEDEDQLLWVEHASWRITYEGVVVVGSSDDQSVIQGAESFLVNREIESAKLNESLDLVVTFTDGANLSLFNTMSEPGFVLWSLFLATEVLFAETGKGIEREARSAPS
jgi:hypothetical protein